MKVEAELEAELRDLDSEIARLQMQKLEAVRRHKERNAQAHFEEAVQLVPDLVQMLRRLDAIGYVPNRLEKALTDEAGVFNPGKFIKRPRKNAMLHGETPEDESTTEQPRETPPKRASRKEDAA